MVFSVFFTLIIGIEGQDKPYYEVETNLLRTLFSDGSYDPEVAPQLNKSIPLVVQVSTSLTNILEVVSLTFILFCQKPL